MNIILGIEVIDKQHREFVEILNRSYISINQNKIDNNISKIFDDIKKYTIIHFKTEEDYFDKFDYEDADNHKLAHKNFMIQIEEFKKQMSEEDNIELMFGVIDYLEDWLVSHLDGFDKKYVKCFKDHGLE